MSKLLSELKVLVVNDELFILETTQEIIKEVGIANVESAQNGLEAYYMILKQHYDLIICDINMPVMNGFDFASKLFEHYQENGVF